MPVEVSDARPLAPKPSALNGEEISPEYVLGQLEDLDSKIEILRAELTESWRESLGLYLQMLLSLALFLLLSVVTFYPQWLSVAILRNTTPQPQPGFQFHDRFQQWLLAFLWGFIGFWVYTAYQSLASLASRRQLIRLELLESRALKERALRLLRRRRPDLVKDIASPSGFGQGELG